MNRRRKWITLAGIAVLLLTGLMIWPGLYAYSHRELAPGIWVPARQNRITGTLERWLLADGWQQVE